MTTSGQAGQPAHEEPAADAAPGPSVPDSEQELREDIERTRERLGDTVAQLAAKADVKARGRAKAAKLAGRVKGTASQSAKQVAARAATVRGQLSDKTGVTPERAREAVAKGTGAVAQRRVPLAAAVVASVAGFVLVRWWRKR